MQILQDNQSTEIFSRAKDYSIQTQTKRTRNNKIMSGETGENAREEILLCEFASKRVYYQNKSYE